MLLTRTGDSSISIEDRVKRMNTHWSADLLVSIHANSAKNKKASGIETYCIKPSLFHGFVSTVKPPLKAIIAKRDAVRHKKSGLLAQAVQKQVISAVGVVNRGVRYAIPRILLTADIPGILIEVGFLTNKKEASLLTESHHQLMLARGICQGVVVYFHMHNT